MRKRIKNSILLLIAFLCMSVNLKEFSLFEKVYADTWYCTKAATTFTCSKSPGNKQHDCSASNFSSPSSACTDGTTYVKDGCQKTDGGSCNNSAYGTQHACELGGYKWTTNYKYTGSITCNNYCDKGTLSGGLCKSTGQSSCESGWTKTAECGDDDVVGNNCAKTSSTDLSSSGWSCTKKEDEKKTWKCTKCKGKDRTDYECTYLSNGCTGSDCYTASEKGSLKVNSAGCPCEDCSSGSSSKKSSSGGGGGGGGNSETTDPTNQDNPYNPQTGTGLILVVWIIGIATIGYSFWYFKKLKTNE